MIDDEADLFNIRLDYVEEEEEGGHKSAPAPIEMIDNEADLFNIWLDHVEEEEEGGHKSAPAPRDDG
jgi:hypothetical protein